MDRWGSCADLVKYRRLLGCCCDLVKIMELDVLDSQNLLTEVLFDPVEQLAVSNYLNCHRILSVGVNSDFVLFSRGHHQDGMRFHVKVFLAANVHSASNSPNLEKSGCESVALATYDV